MTQWQPQHDPRHASGRRPATPPQWQQPPSQWQQDTPRYAPPQPQYQPPPRRRQGGGHGLWIGLGAVVVAAVAGSAFYVLHGSAAKPLTCAQQYQAWKTGPVNADGKKLEADSTTVSKAGEDIKVVSTGLQAMGADATALQPYPMPACADPAGYWSQYLGAIKAAGDNASTATGLGGIILAEAPLKQVPAIQSKLTAELARTAGIKAAS